MGDYRILEALSGDLVHRSHRDLEERCRTAERENRVRIFWFSSEDLLRVLLGKLVVPAEQFPEDARYLRSTIDWASDCFEILVASSEYDVDDLTSTNRRRYPLPFKPAP